MQQEKFLSIQGAVEELAKLRQPYSEDRIRALIDSGILPCAVYWLTRYCWLYVDPMGAAHHEKNGWPEWAAGQPEDLWRSEDNPGPRPIHFTDDKDHPNLNDRMGRPRPGGSGGLNLANFRPGLFIPSSAVDKLLMRETEGVAQTGETEPKPPAPLQTFLAQDQALLVALKNAGYDPENLPANRPGKGGVKAEMKKILLKDPKFFKSKHTFDHAWKRLNASDKAKGK